MPDTKIDRDLCFFLMQMLKTVSISFFNSKLVQALYLEGFLCIENNNISLFCYAYEVIHLIKKGVSSLYVQ